MISDDDMRKALDRIARTDDGRLLYLFLQKTRCAVTSPAVPECALPRNEGRRSFAAELMDHMAEGIAASDGRDAGTGRGGAVVFARSGPISASRHVTAREWLAANPDEQ